MHLECVGALQELKTVKIGKYLWMTPQLVHTLKWIWGKI